MKMACEFMNKIIISLGLAVILVFGLLEAGSMFIA